MAHSNGRIYVDMSTDPDTGVSIEDLRQTLVSSANDIGYIIVNSDINPWALHKPVAMNSWTPLVRNISAEMGFGNASRVVGPPHATTVQGLIDLYTDGDTNYLWGSIRANGWRYLKPRGLSYNEQFRFFDFAKCVTDANNQNVPVDGVGYHHGANNPFGRFDCDESVSRAGGLFWAANDKTIPSSGVSEEDIVIEDINTFLSFKMLYYGILLVPSSTSYDYHLLFNNEHTINDENTGQDYIRGNEKLALDDYYIFSNDVSAITYTAYPFLTNQKIDANARNIAITYANRNAAIPNNPWVFPIPGATPKQVVMYDSLIVFVVHATTADAGYGTSIYVEITNNGNDAVTISDLQLKWRLTSSSWDEPRKTGEVFYDGQYRYDDTGTGVHPDTSSFPFLSQSHTVPAHSTIRLPGAGISTACTVPNANATLLYVGRPNVSYQYGSTNVRVPVVPTL